MSFFYLTFVNIFPLFNLTSILFGFIIDTFFFFFWFKTIVLKLYKSSWFFSLWFESCFQSCKLFIIMCIICQAWEFKLYTLSFPIQYFTTECLDWSLLLIQSSVFLDVFVNILIRQTCWNNYFINLLILETLMIAQWIEDWTKYHRF